MQFTVPLISSLALTALAIPPESFGFPSAPNDTALTVVYNSGTIIQPGNLLGIDVPAAQPQLYLNKARYRSLDEASGPFLALIADPDARYPANPNFRFYLHWLAGNLTAGDVATNPSQISGQTNLRNTSANFAPYIRPSPPTNSSAHRYIMWLFSQPEGFVIPESFQKYGSMSNRASFNVTQFVTEAKLDKPLAANYFYTSNQTAVPSGFIGAPGGQYPGGNGDAIFEGSPGSAPSPTGDQQPTSAPRPTGSAPSSTATGAAAMATPLGLVGAAVMGLALAL